MSESATSPSATSPTTQEPKQPVTTQTVRDNIEQAFAEIEQKQVAIRRSPGGEYGTQSFQERYGALISLCEAIKTRLSGYPNADLFIQDVNRIADFCRQKQDVASDPAWATEPSRARRDLYKAVRDIEDVIEDFSLGQAQEENEAAWASFKSRSGKEIELRSQLDQNKRAITAIRLGESLRSQLIDILNDLAAYLYRVRELTDAIALVPKNSSNRQKVAANQLNCLVDQIKFITKHCDPNVESPPNLLLKRVADIEHKLYRYEYPWGLSWLINRFQDIRRMQSKRGRILAGLGLSVSMAIGTFIFLSVIFAAAASLAYDQQRRTELYAKQNSLAEAVSEWLNHQAEQRNLETTINNLETDKTELTTSFWESAKAADVVSNEESERSLSADTISSLLNALGNPTSADPQVDEFDLNAIVNEANSPETPAPNGDINPSATTFEVTEQGSEILSQLRNLQDIQESLAAQSSSLDTVESALSNSQGQIRDISQEVKAIKEDLDNPSLADNQADSFGQLAQWLTGEALLRNVQRLVLAILAGIMGSAISILIRLDKLDDENIKDPFAFGALKPVVGGMFGVLAFAVVSTKVIDILPQGFEIYTENPTANGGSADSTNTDPLGPLDSQQFYKIFIIAFLAGFSERLVGDTLRSIDRRPPTTY